LIGRMFLSRSLSIALIDVSCKSSYCIIRLMPSVRDYHPDGDDCASEQEYRTRGGDDKKRIGWEKRHRVCRGAVDFMGRDLLCHKEESRGCKGGRC
jgi:hypothetical protein